MSNGLISVVMACHNAAAFVREAVDCVLGQSHPEVELIVVDDGSTDASRDILRSYGDRIRLIEQANAGPYPARNRGLRAVRGEFVAFLDADDWWDRQALEKMHHTLVAHDADLAYCGWQNVGAGVVAAPYVPPAYERQDAVADFVRSCPWPIHGALMRRSLVERLGGFSVRRFSSMDYDLWLRTLALTRNIVRVPEVLAFYRWHGAGQVSAVKWRQVLDALAAQRDFIAANPQLVAHLTPAYLHDVTEGQVLRQAYRAFWKRDLPSAQKLFRHAAWSRACGLRDLRYVLCALLPMPVYRRLVAAVDEAQP